MCLPTLSRTKVSEFTRANCYAFSLTGRSDSIESALPLLAHIIHDSQSTMSGSLLECDARIINVIRWMRSEGVNFNPDLPSYHPGAVLGKWKAICSFSKPSFPNGPNNMSLLLEQNKKIFENEPSERISLKDRVVIVTGAGGMYDH